MNEQQTLPGLASELEEGEPVFILRGRDPLAAHLVALWAAIRKGDTASAVSIHADLIVDPAHKYRVDPSSRASAEKLASACDVSREMVAWREAKGLEAFEVYNVA